MAGVAGGIWPRTLQYAQPVNWDAPLNRGLTAWWLTLPRRGRGARWLDLTGKAHATLTGISAPTATSGWGASTRPGGWVDLRFDGSNDNCTLVPPLSGFVTAAASALSVWCYPLGTAVGTTVAYNGMPIVEDSGGYYGLTRANLSGSDQLWAFSFDTQNRQLGMACTVATWTHVTMVQGGGTLSLYKNGVLVGSPLTCAGPSVLTNSVSIGTGYSGQFWNGRLDDLRIYNRALSAGEVASLYRASSRRYPQELRWQTVPVAFAPAAGATTTRPWPVAVVQQAVQRASFF